MEIMEDLHIQVPKQQLLILQKLYLKNYHLIISGLTLYPGLTDTDLMKHNTKENTIQEEVSKISLNVLLL